MVLTGSGIAAPHFLCPAGLDSAADDPALLRELLSSERFYAILSRHGGVGSTQPYPHADLRPWVEDVLSVVGWDRVMWGSEFPVMYWRNEEIVGCRDWFENLGISLNEDQRRKYLHDNAQRVLFDQPAPPRAEVEIPAWVEEQFDRNRTVPLFPQTALHVPMPGYSELLTDFLHAKNDKPGLSFAEYVGVRLGTVRNA